MTDKTKITIKAANGCLYYGGGSGRMTDVPKITNARRLELIKATNSCLYYCYQIISSLSLKLPPSEYLDYDAIKTARHTLESVCDRALKLAEEERKNDARRTR